MKILNKALELLGLAAVAIGITIGVADAQGDIPCDMCTDVPISSDLVPADSAAAADSGNFIPVNLMTDPNMVDNSE